MACPGRWGRKSSAVRRVLFCPAAPSSWPALVASLLSCGSDVRTRSDVFSEVWCWEGTGLSSRLRLKYILCLATLFWGCAERFWSLNCPSVFPLFWLQPMSQPPYKTMGTTMLLYRRIFRCIEKDLLLQILLSLLTAAAAFPKRVFVSAFVRLSSVTKLARYVNWLTLWMSLLFTFRPPLVVFISNTLVLLDEILSPIFTW